MFLLGFECGPGLVGIEFEETHEVFDRGRVECFVDEGLVGEESEVVNQGFHDVWCESKGEKMVRRESYASFFLGGNLQQVDNNNGRQRKREK